MNRKQFISTVAGATTSTVLGATTIIGNVIPENNAISAVNQQGHNIKRGVALYSFQQAMMLHRMTLEEMLQECSDIGAYGIECIGQVFVEGYPFPTDQWIGKWWELMDKCGTIPVCYTNFHDKELQKNPMNTEDNLEYLKRDMNIARKMGLTKMRMLIGTPLELIEAAIPVAEKLGIWMGIKLTMNMFAVL